MFTVELGTIVESKVSGFKGVTTSRSEHMNGCNRYWIQPRVDKDGKLPDGSWFDEAELVVIEQPKLARANNDRGGFPSRIK